MDSLLVDLDKVLDDFEAEESLAPGTELKPSGFREYLEETNEQTWKVIDNVQADDLCHERSASNISDKSPVTVQYDFPYEPESFDLSEADFAPSSNLGDSGYNGSLALKLTIPPTHSATNGTNSVHANGVFDSAEASMKRNVNLCNPQDGPAMQIKFGNFVKNDLGPGVSKFPVQADNSPVSDLAQGAFQLNGHLGNYEQFGQKTNNVDRAPVLSGSVSNFSSQSDMDKYPVQCNTPQTPKDNPFKNPLENLLNKESNNSEEIAKSASAASNLNVSSHCNQTMQDIPKLNNLQNELVNAQISENKGLSVSHPIKKNSYSLPANFFDQTHGQNGVVHSGSSLPTELSSKADNCNGEYDTESESFQSKQGLIPYDSYQHKQSSGVGSQFFATEFQQPKHENQFIPKQQVVGFDQTNASNQCYAGSSLSGEQDVFVEKATVFSSNPLITDKAMNSEVGSLVAEDQATNANSVGVDVVNDNFNRMGDQIDTLAKLSEQIDSEIGDADLEVFKLLPADTSELVASDKPSVIPSSGTALSPGADVSMDSGCASMTDTGTEVTGSDAGARPKDVHPGYSITNLAPQHDTKVVNAASAHQYGNTSLNINPHITSVSHVERMENKHDVSYVNATHERMEVDPQNIPSGLEEDSDQTILRDETPDSLQTTVDMLNNDGVMEVEMRHHSGQIGHHDERPNTWGPNDSGQPPVLKQKRPTSLNLPPQPAFHPSNGEEDEDGETSPRHDQGASGGQGGDGDMAGGVTDQAEVSLAAAEFNPTLQEAPPPYSSTLGREAPTWVPDAEAPMCMGCELKFTFRKRRHHCRACGKVFCSTCCNMKNKLEYLKYQEARVCLHCHKELAKAGAMARLGLGPVADGNYQSETGGVGQAGVPPTVMVPVHGVLKHDGNIGDNGSSRRTEPKQVMFSDGIRPGGDLTELDGRSSINRTPRRTRPQKRVERTGQGGQQSPRSRRLRSVSDRTCKCLIPDDGLPPLSVPPESGTGQSLQSPDPAVFMPKIKDEESLPVIFAVNANLFVSVKIVNLDCCVSRVVWCFTTRGMTTVGQEEMTIVLEYLPEEDTVPRDIFVHLNNVYEEASKGTFITEMGHTIFNQSFLGSRDHGGFLYIRATFQCVQKLHVPEPPFLFGILLQKWETPWAKVFPIRLLLRLGAEYRYYPCPLIGVRNRKPVFFEIGHTIMNLLADFRNFQYMLPSIRGITIHMEDKVTKINFPSNRYDELMKVVNNSNEHVMAIGANFSSEADSHLVCIQNDEGSYQTQAINIQNKPRKVTGASFMVFNGALKTSSGLTAKSSIVEDGLMVQITPDSMLALKQAIKDMQNYTIVCGLANAPKPDETVIVQWVDEDKNVNIGVKSPVDNMLMDGIESLHVQNTIDYVGETHAIRWTEVFFIQNRDSSRWEPIDLSRLGETLAAACCVALTPNLDKLKELGLTKIGLRVTLGADNVGYEAGSQGQRLPDVYMNDLDNELIPVIHRAIQQDGNIVLELIFQIID